MAELEKQGQMVSLAGLANPTFAKGFTLKRRHVRKIEQALPQVSTDYTDRITPADWNF